MRTGRVFWGVFLLTLGAAFLLDRLGVFSLQWHHAWRWWPLALIAWGAALLFGNKVVKLVAVVVAAIVLALVLTAMFSFSWCDWKTGEGEMAKEQMFREEFTPGVTNAHFSLDSGAGSFTIEDTTSNFIAANTTTSLGNYTLEKTDSDFRLHLIGTHGRHWPPGRMRNHAEVRLNPTPVWDLDFNVGAARVRCDLTPFKVQNLKLNCGAADIDLRLGGGVSESTVKVDAGASSVRLAVPSDVGCEVVIDAPLSSKSIAGFIRMSKGRFQTENFATATSHISIDIDAGVSSIRVERY
jgi:hypothetical protein